MKWIVELWVEGRTDASTKVANESESSGALPSIVLRTLEELASHTREKTDRVIDNEISVQWLKNQMRSSVAFRGTRPKGVSNWAKKMLMAFYLARTNNPATIFIAIRDSDGDHIEQRYIRCAERGRTVCGCDRKWIHANWRQSGNQCNSGW